MGHLSIDFRERELRLLETEGRAKSLKIKKFHLLNLERENEETAEDQEAMGNAIGRVLSKERFTREPSGMALSSSYCIFRDLDLPFKSDDQIKKVIKFEIESTLQSDIDDVVISYFKKTESIDKSHLMVLAVKKALLMKSLGLLQARDVDPMFVDLDLLSIFNSLSATGYLQEEESFLLVNCTTDATHLLVLNQGRLISARAIPMGTETVRKALLHDLKMGRITDETGVNAALGITPWGALRQNLHEAEVEENPPAKEKAGRPSPAHQIEVKKLADNRRDDFLKKLRRELMRTLTFLSADDKPQKIFLTGVGCEMPGLGELLSELFGPKPEELDLLSRVDHDLPSEVVPLVNREIAIPLGIAFKQEDHNATRVDFRQEELIYAKKFDQVKVPMACLTFLLLILMVLLNLDLFMLRNAKNTEMNYITLYAMSQLKTALEDVEGAEQLAASYDPGMPCINGIVRAMEDKNKSLGDMLGREGTIPELPSAFPVWHQFFKVIENHTDDLELFKLNKLKIQMKLRKPPLLFDCEVASGRDESSLKGYLQEVPSFTEFEIGQSKPGPNGTRELKDVQLIIDNSLEEPQK